MEIVEDRDYIFREKGILEDRQGRVAGFWIKSRKGRKDTYLFNKPIRRKKPYRIERKNILVDGTLLKDVPVKVYPLLNSLTHWGKDSKK